MRPREFLSPSQLGSTRAENTVACLLAKSLTQAVWFSAPQNTPAEPRDRSTQAIKEGRQGFSLLCRHCFKVLGNSYDFVSWHKDVKQR